MTKLIFLWISCFVLLISNLNAQTIEVSGNISEDTNWDIDTVKIVGDVTVEEDILLTVSPGVFVEAQGYYRLTIEGNIKAIGEPGDSITFTVNDTTGFWADTTSVAGSWSGIYILGNVGSADSSFFKYCKLQYGKNYDQSGVDVNGGVLYVLNHGYLHINHCLISNNMVCQNLAVPGPFGGAIFCERVDRILIDSNQFIRNRSFNEGGAIRISILCKQTTISHNLFMYNAGFFRYDLPPPWGYVTGGAGAAVSSSSPMNLHSPKISNNYCFNNKGLNGIIYTSNGNAHIFNNVICNNWGNGITDGRQYSNSKFFNNTIANNETDRGGIHVYSTAQIYNNICWGNEKNDGQQHDQIKIDPLGNPNLRYNCVQYGEGGEGAIYDNPEFVEPTEGVGLEYDGSAADWSLLDWSPCINAGTPDTTNLPIPEFDIVGETRIFGERIDIGAYENQVVWVYEEEIEKAEEIIKIYPNPSSTQVTISIRGRTQAKESTLLFYDSFGRKLNELRLTGKSESITMDVSSWQSGMYYVVVSSSNEVVFRERLIVK